MILLKKLSIVITDILVLYCFVYEIKLFEGDILVLNCVIEEIKLISKGCYYSEDRDSNVLYLSAGLTVNFEDQESG